MTPGEVADLLINDYHVFNALNLDGGGSTTMAMEDPFTHTGRVVNVSSDNPSGRKVGSNLALCAAPLPEPVALLSITFTASHSVVVSWPAASVLWRVEQSSSLNPADWQQANITPERKESVLRLSISPAPTTWFYRLQTVPPAQK
jgi:hypothetical protein